MSLPLLDVAAEPCVHLPLNLYLSIELEHIVRIRKQRAAIPPPTLEAALAELPPPEWHAAMAVWMEETNKFLEAAYRLVQRVSRFTPLATMETAILADGADAYHHDKALDLIQLIQAEYEALEEDVGKKSKVLAR
jgi:hypothetical protein